jgi:hypothetical protein
MEVKHLWKPCQPSFSENGNYLVVYDGNWVEIVNAHSAQSTGVIAAKDCQPVALAVGNNGTRLAVANDELEIMGFGPGALFKKSFLDEERSPIDLVSTCGFRDVQICYASDGDRLIMAGHFTETYEARVVVMFWDVKSCSTLSHIVCGERGSSIDGPIFPIRLTEGYGRVENYGVVLRLDDRRWFDAYYQEESYADDEEHYEKITTFITFTSEGKQNGKYIAEHRKVVCGIAGSELIFLQNRNHLWSWKGGGVRPKRMGRIDYKDMPPLKDILGFVLSKGRLTLVAKNDPPSLVFLGGQEHVVGERKVGSIFLSNKVSKRKVRDDD